MRRSICTVNAVEVLTLFSSSLSFPRAAEAIARLGALASGRRLLLVALALALLSAGALAAPPDRAFALCGSHDPEYGDWVNADPNARGIARIELRDCQSVTTCSGETCTVRHDVGWKMRPFGRCSPTNCDWGWSAPRERLSSGHLYGFFDQGFAKRYVYAKMSAYRPGQLWVYVRTDFTDPNRADYELQDWFVRG